MSVQRIFLARCAGLSQLWRKGAKFAGLTNTFSEKQGVIFDRRSLQNLDFTNHVVLAEACQAMLFQPDTRG